MDKVKDGYVMFLEQLMKNNALKINSNYCFLTSIIPSIRLQHIFNTYFLLHPPRGAGGLRRLSGVHTEQQRVIYTPG